MSPLKIAIVLKVLDRPKITTRDGVMVAKESTPGIFFDELLKKLALRSFCWSVGLSAGVWVFLLECGSFC